MSYGFHRSMMNVFLSYKFSGVEKERLDSTIVPIIDLLRKTTFFKWPYQVFCNYEREDFYKESKYTPNDIMQDCFEHIRDSYLFIMFVDKEFGEGMLIEMGYAISLGKKIVLIMHTSVKSISAQSLVEIVITYTEMSDLLPRLYNIMSHFY